MGQSLDVGASKNALDVGLQVFCRHVQKGLELLFGFKQLGESQVGEVEDGMLVRVGKLVVLESLTKLCAKKGIRLRATRRRLKRKSQTLSLRRLKRCGSTWKLVILSTTTSCKDASLSL